MPKGNGCIGRWQNIEGNTLKKMETGPQDHA